VRAKTGSLDGVVTLAGYAETAARERLAFAIFVNDHGSRWGTVVPAVDAMAATIASRGRIGEAAATAAATPAPAAPAAVSERTLTLARTYLAMARAGDRRNVPFLRAALFSEPDPVVRLAVAEALYRSDPDSGGARRALVEAASPALDAAAVTALLGAAEPSDPAPVLGALADLAADGSADALARLVALAPAATAPPSPETLPPATVLPPLAGPLGAILRDLAEAVPDALRAAAAEARPEARAAAAALVGDRLPGLAGPAAESPGIGPAAPSP
jgi:D-alanyl-D-alanine carboxypeptidase/D-alanyl-D-alanine-endopeptidase (penicillin-binding protein 4)